MIQLENISVKVASKVLLDNISLQLESGKMNLIIGPNGAGKSTLIKVLCKQTLPTTGSVFFEDQALNTLSLEQLSTFRAVLSQNSELAFPLKASQVVMMGRYPHFKNQPTRQDIQAVEEAMRFFDVWSFADRNYLTLSGGEKQRVQFARVLAQIWFPTSKARYLLLDEPLTFLDIHYQIQFMHQLKTLLIDKSLTVIGVLHDLNLAGRFADTILLLNNGKVLANGSPEEVLTKETMKTAFQLEPEIIMSEKTKSLHLVF